MKLFFLGGTFDPPHIGHLEIAKTCLKYCDKFIFIPSKQAPHKVEKPYFSDKQRLDMLTLIIKGYENIEINSFELDSKESISYSINTINYLSKKYQKAEIFMVVGSDIIDTLSTWKDWVTIKDSVKLVCINRPKYIIKEKVKYIRYIDDINMNISSSHIRKLISSDKKENLLKISQYITKNVFQYIFKTINVNTC